MLVLRLAVALTLTALPQPGIANVQVAGVVDFVSESRRMGLANGRIGY